MPKSGAAASQRGDVKINMSFLYTFILQPDAQCIWNGKSGNGRWKTDVKVKITNAYVL